MYNNVSVTVRLIFCRRHNSVEWLCCGTDKSKEENASETEVDDDDDDQKDVDDEEDVLDDESEEYLSKLEKVSLLLLKFMLLVGFLLSWLFLDPEGSLGPTVVVLLVVLVVTHF